MGWRHSLVILAAVAGAQASFAETVNINFTYGSEKEAWIKAVTADFNRSNQKTQSGKIIQVNAIAKGSGEAVDEIMSGNSGPDEVHVTSPASSLYLNLANTKFAKISGGKTLLQDQGSLVSSPVVIAMWEPEAKKLGWPSAEIGWGDIMKLAAENQNFRFGHTHPEKSNSGLSAIVAQFYAGAQVIEGRRIRTLTEQMVGNNDVRNFVKQVQSHIVFYGSSTGFYAQKLLELGPNGMTAAVIYESDVISRNKAIRRQGLALPKLVAIYPKEGTFATNHPIAIVNREWVSNEEREAASVYIEFLKADEQQRKAVESGFQPTAKEQIDTSLEINAENGVNPDSAAKMLPIPRGEVIEQVLEAWKNLKNKSKVVVVLDHSGSMEEGKSRCEDTDRTPRKGRICGAREGTALVLENLRQEDTFQLIVFDDKLQITDNQANLVDVAWGNSVYAPLNMNPYNKQKVTNRILNVVPRGGTSLYDSVNAAFNMLCGDIQKNPADKSIRAVIVLTDGDDRNSSLSLESLMNQVGYAEAKQNELERNPSFSVWQAENTRLNNEIDSRQNFINQNTGVFTWPSKEVKTQIASAKADIEVLKNDLRAHQMRRPQEFVRGEALRYKGNPQCKVPIFSIGYEAPDTSLEVLKRISAGTGGKFIEGNPAKIKSIFQDLATFL